MWDWNPGETVKNCPTACLSVATVRRQAEHSGQGQGPGLIHRCVPRASHVLAAQLIITMQAMNGEAAVSPEPNLLKRHLLGQQGVRCAESALATSAGFFLDSP